jgi:glycosyltransferase involved in cell wall biosynthesis
MTVPLISVVLPTYNRAALLAEAVASVLAQSFENWECIVVDDGSTDETPELLARISDRRLRRLTIPHSGNPAVPRNAALAVARGRLLAFLDDDDLWYPEKLAVQLPLLAGGRCRWSYTGFIRRDRDGRESWRAPPDRLPDGAILGALLETRAAVALPTVMAERALVTEAGGFDAALRTREDYALWLTLAERAPVAVAPEPLTIVRDHAGRVFRPEANRMSLVLYGRWLERVSDPGLRRICRRRLAETHLTEARRQVAAGRWPASLPSVLRAARQAPTLTLGRGARALGRRLHALVRAGSRPTGP